MVARTIAAAAAAAATPTTITKANNIVTVVQWRQQQQRQANNKTNNNNVEIAVATALHGISVRVHVCMYDRLSVCVCIVCLHE